MPGRPGHLLELGPNLPQELRRRGALAALEVLDAALPHGLHPILGRGLLPLHHPLGLSVHASPFAGPEGLEPPTAGFGDRCSTKLSNGPLDEAEVKGWTATPISIGGDPGRGKGRTRGSGSP